MSLRRLLGFTEPEIYAKNRAFLKNRRKEQFKLLDDPSIQVDRAVLDMPLKDLVGRPNLAYAFGREAIKHEKLGALADVYF